MVGPVPDNGRVVVGVDGSKHARRALRWAVDEAHRRGSKLEVVWAWLPAAIYPPFDDGRSREEAERRELEALDRLLVDEGLAADALVPIVTSVVQGLTVQVLLDAAVGADLLVLGSHGHSTFAGALLGSVSLHCMTHAACPVVIVRAA